MQTSSLVFFHRSDARLSPLRGYETQRLLCRRSVIHSGNFEDVL